MVQLNNKNKTFQKTVFLHNSPNDIPIKILLEVFCCWKIWKWNYESGTGIKIAKNLKHHRFHDLRFHFKVVVQVALTKILFFSCIVYFLGFLVELFYIPLIEYMYDLM